MHRTNQHLPTALIRSGLIVLAIGVVGAAYGKWASASTLQEMSYFGGLGLSLFGGLLTAFGALVRTGNKNMRT